MSTARTFSESWYRVASQRITLRPQAQIQKQIFRGSAWYVIRDPFSNRFFRLRPEAYEFAARLRSDRTVEAVWEECLRLDPDNAPGQDEVIQLLSQLYHANLLHYDIPADSAELFERHRRMTQRETTSKLLNVMFAHIPLLDPDPLLRRLTPILRLLVSPLGALIWLLTVCYAIKLGADQFAELRQHSQGVLDPSNLFLLYLSLALLKTAHEFGHAFVCRRFGGEVHTMGVMLLIFTPLPYMDATSSWAFRSRWKRVLVGASGMIVELFVAALAMIIWTRTGPGTIHSIAYNMIFIASVSTVLFNGNPLLRFDGYYILSDVLDVPNLHQQCTRQLTHLVEKYAFGVRPSVGPAATRREAFGLALYGIASLFYRIAVFVRILFFVADRFLLLGVIMLCVCLVSWVLTPVARLIHYLLTNPRLARTRQQAMAVTLAAGVAVFLSLYQIPYPDRFRAPGMLSAVQKADVITETSGYVREIVASSGEQVGVGQPLLILHDERLAHETEAARTRCDLTRAQLRKALEVEPADLVPLQERLRVHLDELASLERRAEQQIVRAPLAGLWISPTLHEMDGRFMRRGITVGQVVDTSSFVFAAMVSQDDTSRLFGETIRETSVRVRGRAGRLLSGHIERVIAAEKDVLPSAVLGWLGGGSIQVDPRDPLGLRTVEPFFEVRVALDSGADLAWFHGRTGTVRFELARRPLLLQWYRRLRQLLQKRYRL